MPGVLHPLRAVSLCFVTVTALLVSGCAAAQTPGPSAAGVALQTIADDAAPGSITNVLGPAHASGLLFLTEQAGRILTLDVSAAGSAEPVINEFLDLRDQVNTDGREEGLLGLAFHPDFAANGQLYVHYSAAEPRRSVISQFALRDDGAADPDSEVVLLEVPQPFGNHNGGQLAFGPDGYLYIALGDGGSGGDPEGHGQNPTTLLGAILRIDVNHSDAELAYSVPADNPFVGDADARSEVWAYGLRNPWRFSFDRETGALWVGDVGQNVWEAVYIVERAKNYGWNVVEGANCYPPGAECDPDLFPAPVYTYRIDGERECAVTGGYVYRGSNLPELQGVYVLGDFCSGRVWGLRSYGEDGYHPELLLETGLSITTFGEDQSGELYLATIDGEIYGLTTTPIED